MQPVMEKSPPTSGRSATPADINRNGRPTSIGTGGRHQSECPADIIGMRNGGLLKTAQNRAAFFEQSLVRKFALVRQSADEDRS
jgi:hypothetical protein